MERCSCFGRIRGPAGPSPASAASLRSLSSANRAVSRFACHRTPGEWLVMATQGGGRRSAPLPWAMMSRPFRPGVRHCLSRGSAALECGGKRSATPLFRKGTSGSAAPPDVPPRPPLRYARCRTQTKRCRASLALGYYDSALQAGWMGILDVREMGVVRGVVPVRNTHHIFTPRIPSNSPPA